MNIHAVQLEYAIFAFIEYTMDSSAIAQAKRLHSQAERDGDYDTAKALLQAKIQVKKVPVCFVVTDINTNKRLKSISFRFLQKINEAAEALKGEYEETTLEKIYDNEY